MSKRGGSQAGGGGASDLPIGEFRDAKDLCKRQIPESATTVLLGECTHGTEEFYKLR